MSENRMKRLRADMELAGVKALVLLEPHNTYYVCGDNAIVYSRPYLAFVPLDTEPTVVVEHLREAHARQRSRVTDIRVYRPFSMLTTSNDVPKDPFTLIRKLAEDQHLTKARIGIEMDYLPVTMFQGLKEVLPDASFVEGSAIVQNVRMIKDEDEVEMIRRASELSDRGMEVAVDSVREGVREIDVCVAAQNAMNEMWRTKYPEDEVSDLGIGDSSIHHHLWCQCMTGPSTRSPTARRINRGDVLWLNVSAVLNCYHTSNERTVIVGEATDRHRKAFETAIEAQRTALSVLRPGIACCEVNSPAAGVIQRGGFEEHVKSRTGHSLGLNSHEKPFLGEGDRTVIQENMVFAVEPGFRAPYGIFQHSDTVVVTKSGFKRLTKYPNTFLTA